MESKLLIMKMVAQEAPVNVHPDERAQISNEIAKERDMISNVLSKLKTEDMNLNEGFSYLSKLLVVTNSCGGASKSLGFCSLTLREMIRRRNLGGSWKVGSSTVWERFVGSEETNEGTVETIEGTVETIDTIDEVTKILQQIHWALSVKRGDGGKETVGDGTKGKGTDEKGTDGEEGVNADGNPNGNGGVRGNGNAGISSGSRGIGNGNGSGTFNGSGNGNGSGWMDWIKDFFNM